jgi:hypothetical protein
VVVIPHWTEQSAFPNLLPALSNCMEIHDSCIRADFGCKSLLKISQAQYYFC